MNKPVVLAFRKLHAERAARSGIQPQLPADAAAAVPAAVPATPPAAPAAPVVAAAPAVMAPALPKPALLPAAVAATPAATAAPLAPTPRPAAAPVSAPVVAPAPTPSAAPVKPAPPVRPAQVVTPVRAAPTALPAPPPSAATPATRPAKPAPVATLVKAATDALERPIVRINEAALLAAGLMPPAAQQRRMAAEYRQIKRPLLARMQGRGVSKLPNGHLIMVTSALPGEGKTFTSINLAMSLALEKDLSVLLVDADVTKPHVSSLFGIERQLGLLDLLQDSMLKLDKVVLPTSVPGLSLLPAGTQNENATELLASAGMDRLVESIARLYPNTVVLFDASPLLLTIEPRVLAQFVGQIVLVVRSGMTSHAEVQEAIATVGHQQNIGLVLNQCERPNTHGFYYGYAPSDPAENEPRPAGV